MKSDDLFDWDFARTIHWDSNLSHWDNRIGIDLSKLLVMRKEPVASKLKESRSPFIDFVWRTPNNRKYIWIAFVLMAIQLGVFKYIYPYPNLSLDSYFYIKAAVLNLSSNVWPIGYSRFIQLFGLFSHSHLLFVIVQFLLLELACLIFFFSWSFLFNPGKLVKNLLFAALFINPLFLFSSNFVLSDALFIALSIGWITQLLWIIYSPRPWMIFSHAALIVLAFTVRYNALYYPGVFTLAFILCRLRIVYKIAGISIPILLLWAFISYTSRQAIPIGGHAQFSPFGNWRLANNGLYGYAHVTNRDAIPEDREMRALDSAVQRYFQGVRRPIEMNDQNFSGSFFMFDMSSPLVIYIGGDKEGLSFLGGNKWAEVAPLYQSYGNYLIRKYPMAFIRYYLWPNFQRYMVPPQDMAVSVSPFTLLGYAAGANAKKVFGLTTIAAKKIDYILWRKNIVDLYPYLFALIHCCFLFGFLGFLFCRGFAKVGKPYSYMLWLVMTLWLCDMGFIVFSSGVWVRYMVFIMIVEMAFGLYFLEFAFKNMDKPVTDKMILPIPDKAL